MSSRARLDSTVLAPIDLADQPACPLLFLIDTAAGGRQAFTVDNIKVEDGIVYGLRWKTGCGPLGGYCTIIAVPAISTWTVLSREVVLTLNVEESMRKRKEGDMAQVALMEELYPAGPQNLPAAMGVANAPMTGHYL